MRQIFRDSGAGILACRGDALQPIQIKRRRLPHWTIKDATYFVTFRLVAKQLDDNEIVLVINHIVAGDKKFYWLIAAIVMPDHAHLILRPNADFSLSRILHGMKGMSARLLNKKRQTKGTVWQDESLDRIIRSEEELYEKLKYMYENPVRKGLVDDGSKYVSWYCNLIP